MLVKNKKAGEKILSIWWFFVLVIIAGGVVIGVTMFYVGDSDVRGLEADVLASKILDCIVESGEIDMEISKENIFEKCNLNKEILDESGNYYVNISVFREDNSLEKEIRFGANIFEKDCKIREKVIAPDFAVCSEKSVFVFDRDNKKLKLNVLAGSNYRGEK